MLITLVRNGGIIPITKKAEKEVDWTEDEINKLLKVSQNADEGPGQMRDSAAYQLQTYAGTFPIDLDKVPAKNKKTFEELKDNLKIVKG